MRRSLTLFTALVVASSLVAMTTATILAQQSKTEAPPKDKAATQQRTREQFYSAEASLFSALAHAHALERITEGIENPDFSLSRTLISTASRAIQGVDSSSVNLGQANHELEKTEAMETLRSELNAATKAADEAHQAADGHGAIGPHAKNMTAHLLKAVTALIDLADDIGIETLVAPGAEAVRDALKSRSP